MSDSASPTTSQATPIPAPSKRSLRTNYERSPAKHVAPKSNIACRAQAMTLRVYGGKSYEEIEKTTGMKQRQVVKFINQAKELGWNPDGSSMDETMLKEEYLSVAALNKLHDKKIVEVMTTKYQVSKTTAKRSLERAKEQGWADKLREATEDSAGLPLIGSLRRSTSSGDAANYDTDPTPSNDLDADADGEPDDNVTNPVLPSVATTDHQQVPLDRHAQQQQQSQQQMQPQQQLPQHVSPQQHQPQMLSHIQQQHVSSQNSQVHQLQQQQRHLMEQLHQQQQQQRHQLHTQMQPQQRHHSINDEGLLEQNIRAHLGYLQYQQPSNEHLTSSGMNNHGQHMSLSTPHHS